MSMVFPPHSIKREKSYPFPRRSCRQLTLAKQTQNSLRQLVGLGQHRSTRLLHDLVLGQVGGLGSVVGIHDASAGGRGVLSNVLQVADSRLEAILDSTQISTLSINSCYSLIDSDNCFLRALNIKQVDISDRLASSGDSHRLL